MKSKDSAITLRRAIKQSLARLPLVAAWKYKWSDQFKSNLFKLPYEIREKIWALVVQGHAIQLSLVGEELRAVHLRWWGNNWKPAGVEMDLLCLPLTCRRIYTETIHRIYSHNTFHLIGAHVICALPNTIPRLSLDLISRIRSLEIWRGGPTALEDALAVLSTLQGLRKLEIECSGTLPDNSHWSRTLDGSQILMNEATIRQALHKFGQVESIKLTVYEEADEVWRGANPVPSQCVVERRRVQRVTQKKKRIWYRRAYERPGGVLELDSQLASVHYQ